MRRPRASPSSVLAGRQDKAFTQRRVSKPRACQQGLAQTTTFIRRKATLGEPPHAPRILKRSSSCSNLKANHKPPPRSPPGTNSQKPPEHRRRASWAPPEGHIEGAPTNTDTGLKDERRSPAVATPMRPPRPPYCRGNWGRRPGEHLTLLLLPGTPPRPPWPPHAGDGVPPSRHASSHPAPEQGQLGPDPDRPRASPPATSL
nr:uncharacterized protein LOC127315866 [Lolium perenne]